MCVEVTKMQGCGNDFVILEDYLKFNMPLPEIAKALCNRHFGVGADGLIIPNPNAEDADIGWFFYNSDGSTAQMCGNGMRCFAKYAYDKKLVKKKEFTVKTLAGIISPKITSNGNVTVNMSKPVLESDKIPFIPVNNMNYKIAAGDMIFEGHAVSMGNPHFVIFTPPDADLLELAKKYGPIIETSAEFPEKTNVEFVKIRSEQKIDLCVWERGCGITLACGTGACASVAAGILNGSLKKSVLVRLLGGMVQIDWDGNRSNPDKDIFLTGSAKYVFTAKLQPEFVLKN